MYSDCVGGRISKDSPGRASTKPPVGWGLLASAHLDSQKDHAMCFSQGIR